ncbi:MAG TPA: SpoIIE family protein phosphatase [Terriglobia bacterium]|nr:SpoIIE family protein phosphatase [Terriglobia bacterium]
MGLPVSIHRAEQSTVRLDSQDPFLSIQHITVFVQDQERSLRFFLDQLGFRLVSDCVFENGRRWVAVGPPDGTAVLSLVAPEPGSKAFELIGRPTQIVFVTEDFDAKFHQWRSRGVRFLVPRLRRMKFSRSRAAPDSTVPTEVRRAPGPVWGGVFATFKDVDGNSYGLVGIDEVTREIEAQRRAAAEKLESERRAAQELEIAKQVQARLFPQSFPLLRTLDCAGACIQARQVGGDYYDFIDLGPDRVALVIGDISGKGIAAALLMASLHASLRTQCAVAVDQPQRLLRSVNQFFYQNTDDNVFSTLFFALYDDRSRLLRYASCGHQAALLLHHDGALEQLGATGPVLGLFQDWDGTLEERPLDADDTLAIYTDGLIESFNRFGEEFGEQRLMDALRRHRRLPSGELLEAVVGEVRRFSPHEQHDDITLIVAQGRPHSR